MRAKTVPFTNLNQTSFGQKVRWCLRSLPGSRDMVAAYHTMSDRNTPIHVKILIYVAVAYFLLPLDLLFDGLPFVGLADDAAVFGSVVNMVASYMTDLHYEMADAWLSS